MSNELPHPNFRMATHVLKKAVEDAPNLALVTINSHLANHPRGGTVAAYSKRYAQGANAGDEMAVHLHKAYDYSGAANQMDRATGEFESMHHMMAYNLGAEHPAVKTLGDMIATRHELASSYRQSVGLGQEDTDKKFNDIVQNHNRGQQFEGQ